MTEELPDREDPPASSSSEKKPYQPPVLVRLGALKDLTRSVGYRGNLDGGRFPRGFRTAY